jgi:DNA repair protein RadB
MSKISAGNFELNKWLKGGYDSDIITTLFGGPGTGKTNIGLICAVSQAKKGKKVLFIDTEGGFSSDRVKQLVGKENGLNYKKVLENILILKPTNFNEQKKSFDKLLEYIGNGKFPNPQNKDTKQVFSDMKKQISLIIVDGMTMLYRLEFANARINGEKIEGIQKVNAELTKQMRLLAEISRKRNIPVIVTNQVYNWDNESKMVGGDILKYWSKCLIELVNDRGRRYAFLRKHRSLPEKSLAFQIFDEGIRKRGWI